MKKLHIAISTSERTNLSVFMDVFQSLGAECSFFSGNEADIDYYDGLLLPGGPDVEPWRYGEENTHSYIEPGLDELQFSALDRFSHKGKTIFGICRGYQLINVYFGGSLIQHLSNAEKHMKSNGIDSVHEIRSLPGCFLSDLYGEKHVVNSSHHQAINKAGTGLHICAYDADDVPEAFYHETLPIFGVQYHPERMCLSYTREDTVNGMPIFEFFLCRCAEQSRK